MINKTTQIAGMLAISYNECGNVSVQFLPDEQEPIMLESLHFEGSAQLLRSGQFEFVSIKFNILKIN